MANALNITGAHVFLGANFGEGDPLNGALVFPGADVGEGDTLNGAHGRCRCPFW